MQHSLSSPCFVLSVYFPSGGSCLNQYRFWIINTTDFFPEQTASKKVLIMCFQGSIKYFSNLSIFFVQNYFKCILFDLSKLYIFPCWKAKREEFGFMSI